MPKRSAVTRRKPQKSGKSPKGKDAPFPLRAPNKRTAGLYFEIIKFSTIDKGNSGPQAPKQKVIRSANELALVLGNKIPPTLDFSKDEAVVVALGEKPTSGFGIEITSITYFTDRGGDLPPLLSVTYAIKTGKQSADGITHPFHVVKIKKLKGDVEFNLKGA